MIRKNLRNKKSLVKQICWWALLFVCVFYALYAFYMGALELLSLMGMVTDAPERAVPVAFVIHAFSGGIALLIGPLQFRRQLLGKRPRLHRILGRIYVAAIWLASIDALISALFFDVTVMAKIGFIILAVLWFGSTTIGLQRIRRRQVAVHREWMIRSFALSFFFVTFSLWVPGLTSTTLPETISYPLAVFLSWSLNLLVAEIWIRQTRRRRSQVLVRRALS